MAWFPGIVSYPHEEDSAIMKKLEDLGVQVVCTNRPDLFTLND